MDRITNQDRARAARRRERSTPRRDRRVALLGCALLCLATPLTAQVGASDESVGDGHRARADVVYERARRLWTDLRREFERLEDTAAQARVDRVLASVAALRLRREEFVATGVVAPAWSVTAPVGREADDAAFERLFRFLSAATRRYGLVPEVTRRDVLLVDEARATIELVRGDLIQAEADAKFRAGLTAVAGVESRRADEIRLRVKLRDFEGALALDPGESSPRVFGDSLCVVLADLHRSAVFLGRADDVAALEARLGRCTKESDPKTPGGFGRSLLGSKRAELVDTVNTLVRLLSDYRLPARSGALAAYIAALASIELGEYALAEELLRTRVSGAAGDPWLHAVVLSRLGFARDQTNDPEGALLSYREAKALTSGMSGVEPLRHRLDLGEARVLLSLGKSTDVLAATRELLREKGVAPRVRVEARLLVGAVLYREAAAVAASSSTAGKAIDAARAVIDAARREAETIEDDAAAREELLTTIAVHVGNLQRLDALAARSATETAEHRARAVATLDGAMRTAHEKGWIALAAVASANLGELRLEGDDPVAAGSFVEWALERAREERLFDTEWRCLWYLARIADAKGDGAAADARLASAIQLVESLRGRILDADTKAGFMSDKLDLFRWGIARAVRLGRSVEALELAERARARSLVDSLGWRYVSLADPNDAELFRSYISLVGREARARTGGSAQLLGLPAEGAGDYDSLRASLAELRRRITSSPRVSPALRALVDGAPATWSSIRTRLPRDATLLEYFDAGAHWIAIVADAERVTCVPLTARPDAISSRVRDFVAAGAGEEALARALHADLLAAVEPIVRTERVIIVPYGPLHGLPFESLRGADGYQIQRWEVSYLPSASVIEYTGRSPRAVTSREDLSLLALADPFTDYDGDGTLDKVALAGARQEVSQFSGGFRSPSVFYGPSATESTLRSRSGAFDIVHLACHGEFYPSRPWDSTLFLAQGDGTPSDDGRLRAHEVYGLDLRGLRMVALSGCETGVAELVRGDDPAGIATAFLHTGASSLLVSLWKVEDRATALLMQSFYENWNGDVTRRSAALRAAKLRLLESGYSHPRQWASFVLIAES